MDSGKGVRENYIHFKTIAILDVLDSIASINLYIYTRTIDHVTQGGDMDRIRRNL